MRKLLGAAIHNRLVSTYADSKAPRMRPRLLLLVIVLLPFGVALAAPEPGNQPKLAVLELELGAGVTIDRLALSDQLRTLARDAAPHLFIMTRESTEMLLKASGSSLEKCLSEGVCETDVAKKLGADYVVSGRIAKVGTRLMMSLKLHDTSTGQLLQSQDLRAKNADELVDEIDKRATALLAPLHPRGKVGPAAAADGNAEVSSAAGAVDGTRQGVAKPPGENASPQAGTGSIEPKSGLRFIAVPAGAFSFQGTSTSVNAFRFGQTATTIEAYERCVSAGGCTEPKKENACNWRVSGREKHPVNCVDWNQAGAFCRWIGGRLPSKEEREYAATGGEGREYPWGSADPGARACWNGEGNDLGKGNRKSTCPVGDYPAGVSKWGLHDLAGNVWEWTSSDYDVSEKVLRGGSWMNVSPQDLGAVYRSWSTPSATFKHIGFRCVMPSSGH